MNQFGTLRLWAAVLTVLGTLSVLAAAAGTIILAIEANGAWPTIGVLLLGGPVSIFLASLPIALAQALRGIADVGDMVSAR
jgi:hypothetical protein